MRQLMIFFVSTFLAVVPAFGQTVIGVLGGTGLGTADAGAVVEIDTTTGAATVLGTPIPGESLTGVARLNSGRVVASTAGFTGPSRLIEIDPATGALIADIGPFIASVGPITLHDLTANPQTGLLYGISIGSGDRAQGEHPRSSAGTNIAGGTPDDENAFFRIDSTTGACTYIGTPNLVEGGFLAIAAGSFPMAAVPTNSAVLYGFNETNGALLNAIAITGSNFEGALGLTAITGDGLSPQYLMSACCDASVGNDIYRLDGFTGVATLLGSAGGTRRVHDMVEIPAVGPGAVPIVEVPVSAPSLTALTLLLALAGGLFLHRSG